MAHVESPKDNLDATCATDAGILEELERKASGEAIKVTQEIGAAEMEGAIARGAANEARYKEAGEEQSHKSATAEQTVATEGILKAAPTAAIVSNLAEVHGRDHSNKGDVQKLKANGATTPEDQFKQIKAAPKMPPMHTSKDSARNINEKLGTSGDIATTKGAKSNAECVAKLKSGAIQQVVQNKFEKGFANEKVMSAVQAAKQKGPNTANEAQHTPGVTGPGGVGGGAVQRVATAQNSINTFKPRSPLDGPVPPENYSETDVG